MRTSRDRAWYDIWSRKRGILESETGLVDATPVPPGGEPRVLDVRAMTRWQRINQKREAAEIRWLGKPGAGRSAGT